MRETCEAFGVAYAKIASWTEKGRHFVNEFLLSLLVEVNHYVSAENQIEQPFKGIRVLQIEPVKCDDPFYILSYLVVRPPIPAGDLLKMSLSKRGRDLFHFFLRVDP